MERESWGDSLLFELLVCPSCSSWLNEPRSLSCQHACCTACLDSLLETSQGGDVKIICPACSCITRVPTKEDLPPSTNLTLLSDFKEMLCRAAAARTPSPTPTEITNSFIGSVSSLLIANNRPLTQAPPLNINCEKHKQLLNIHCCNCEEDICTLCLHEEHRDHKWSPAGEYSTQVSQQLSRTFETLKQLQDVPGTCGNRLKIVTERRKEIQGEIETAFQQLHQELDARKSQLLRVAEGLSEKQLRLLKLHKEKAQQRYKLLAAFYEAASEQIAGDQKPVIIYRECAQKLQEILATFTKRDKTLPVELKVNLALWQAQTEANHDAFHKYIGQVILRPSAQSGDVLIEGKGAERAISGLPTHFKVVVVPTEGQPLPMLTDDIMCSLEPQLPNGDISVGTCLREADGMSCKMTYTPAQAGPHLLKLFLNEIPLAGSPLAVEVGPSLVDMEQQPQLLKQGKKQLRALAVGKTGQTMALVKSKTSQVKLYYPGKKSKNVGKKGLGEGQFFTPSHVAFTPDSKHFLVTDLGNHRVQKFTISGQPCAVVGKRGSKELQFNTPASITVDNKGRVYVADLGNNRIQVLTSDLRYHNSITCLPGATPSGLGVDTEGMLYVSYRELHCVQKYDTEGQPLLNFGAAVLSRPTCLCVSRLDLVFVGDEASHSVSVFTSEGELLHQYGRRGTRTVSIQLSRPAGVAVDDENHLYISDMETGRLIKL